MTETLTPSVFDNLHCLIDLRYSCRAFQSRPVEKAVIDKILAVAQRTPSWCNTQPWEVYVTMPEATERLRNAMTSSGAPPGFDIAPPTEYEGIFKDRRRESGLQLYDSVGIAKSDREGAARQAAANFSFFGAPHVAIITTEEKLGAYGALDCGAFVHAFTLIAKSLGVACIAQAALAARSAFFRERLDIPAHRQVVCGISFGFEESGAPVNGFRTNRAQPDEVVHWVST